MATLLPDPIDLIITKLARGSNIVGYAVSSPPGELNVVHGKLLKGMSVIMKSISSMANVLITISIYKK